MAVKDQTTDAYSHFNVYGSRISYYTGKLETYLRFLSIPYTLRPTVGNRTKLISKVGIVQMPVVEMADGRWMTDTTPIMSWIDSKQSHSIYPSDPKLRFLALLIEDYADEWLWRPAMYYRWNDRIDRQNAAEILYRELVKGTLPLPRFIALNLLKRRQLGGYVRGDGVTSKTEYHVIQTYVSAIDKLQNILETRPFIFGESPTIADFGMMGPMLRHFGQDPTPAEIMRKRGPAVFEWVYRMWNSKKESSKDGILESVDKPLQDFLQEVCETHLAQLKQNALAFGRGERRYKQTIQDCNYQRVPMSRYRVWCLEELRRHWRKLGEENQSSLKAILKFPEANVLWDDSPIAASNYDVDGEAPFNRAIKVFERGVPIH